MTTKTASLATARAPTTSMLLRRVYEATRSLTARILVELRRSSLTSVDAGDGQAAGLQRHPAERWAPHRQLPRGDPQLGSRPGHIRQHLLYRRPARHYAAAGPGRAAGKHPRPGRHLPGQRDQAGPGDVHPVARARACGARMDLRDLYANRLAGADDAVQGSSGAAGTRTD